MNSSVGAPPPPPPIKGNIPVQRIQTQLPPEAPACVQNAMMTKDKKPFTYTPGGIDLSQIKSPRMAQRLERNKNSEGVSNQPRPQNQNSGPPRPPGQNGAIAAMGTPVQVFPTGAPAPPPPPPKNNLGTNSSGSQKSDKKSPQIFEPPPMGCRPEIKIPPNPMANLRPTPKPQEKNDFWIEEYRKERSKSPNVNSIVPSSQPEENKYEGATFENTNSNFNNNAMTQKPTSSFDDNKTNSDNYNYPSFARSPSPVRYNPSTPVATQYQSQSPAVSQYQHTPPAVSQYQPPPPQPPPRQPVPSQGRQQTFSPPVQSNPGNYTPQPAVASAPWRRPEHQRLDSPYGVASSNKPTVHLPQSPETQSQRREFSPMRSTGGGHVTNTKPQSNTINSYQQNNSQPKDNYAQSPLAPSFAERNTNVGTLYIPPIYSEFTNRDNSASQSSASKQTPVANNQTPPWLQKKNSQNNQPEWVNTNPDYREANILPSSVNSNGLNGSFNNSKPNTQNNQQSKERIIAIQLEKTPTPTKTPTKFDFNNQSYYNEPQSRYGSATGGYTSPTNNPNKFVDQGYNDLNTYGTTSPTPNNRWGASNTRSTATYNNKEHVIPIHIEGQTPTSGSNSPVVLQTNPRTLQHQNSWGNSNPNQSKSFRVLQKITNTSFDEDDDKPAELQQPHFAKTLTLNDSYENQKRNQLAENERIFLNRVKSQDKYSHDEVEPRYRGPSIPSKAFKMLQNMY